MLFWPVSPTLSLNNEQWSSLQSKLTLPQLCRNACCSYSFISRQSPQDSSAHILLSAIWSQHDKWARITCHERLEESFAKSSPRKNNAHYWQQDHFHIVGLCWVRSGAVHTVPTGRALCAADSDPVFGRALSAAESTADSTLNGKVVPSCWTLSLRRGYRWYWGCPAPDVQKGTKPADGAEDEGSCGSKGGVSSPQFQRPMASSSVCTLSIWTMWIRGEGDWRTFPFSLLVTECSLPHILY